MVTTRGIFQLPDVIANRFLTDFDEIFSLHPAERGRIITDIDKNMDSDSHRWHQSFLQTPSLDTFRDAGCQSYMYGGRESAQISAQTPLPMQFQPLLDWMNTNEKGRYNQCTVSWYENGADRCKMHRDGNHGMVPNYKIASLSLFRSPVATRQFRLKAKSITTDSVLPTQGLFVEMRHGSVVVMCGDTDDKFRHGVPSDASITEPRIGVSFRMFA